MIDRPILFSAPMVRSLLDCTKSQTRRAVKLPRGHHWADKPDYPGQILFDGKGDSHGGELPVDELRCPYGQPGDRLWVREAWTTHAEFDSVQAGDLTTRSFHYQADGNIQTGRTRAALHMPRRASRITLRITGVRAERLRDISEADALAEGVNVHADHHGKPRASIYSPVQAYADLWEQINGPGSWSANPWVWCLTFEVLT